MEEFKIVIANDFSNTPGGRWKSFGPNSGEEFYETILLPKYEDALSHSENLHIYLDGVRSYPSSFLDQSFGELARKKGVEAVLSTLIFHSQAFDWIVDFIKNDIWVKK